MRLLLLTAGSRCRRRRRSWWSERHGHYCRTDRSRTFRSCPIPRPKKLFHSSELKVHNSFFRRTPFLRLFAVSNFPRLDKLGHVEGLRWKVVQSRLGTAKALGFSSESRILLENVVVSGGLAPGKGIENIAPDTLVRLGLVRLV